MRDPATPVRTVAPQPKPEAAQDTCNVLIVGVGGQGVIMVSKVLAQLAQTQGHEVKQSEVHGMAKRGGSVFSHVRFGSRVWSPTIPKGDVDILNTALGLEYEGIAAYQVGAESGLLQPAVLKLAVGFQSDHKQHAEALVKAITSMGGAPVQPKTVAEYNFPTSTLHNQTDVLKFAAGLEQGAVSAYKGAIPLFANRDLAGAGASILGSEAMHWAILNSALGVEPPTVAFVS